MKYLLVLCLVLSAFGSEAQRKSKKIPVNHPVFSEFTYTGNDRVFSENPLDGTQFYNPLLTGCYPDPSICRRGNDYFMVNSSFAMFPGVPVFHSTDLVNWRQIGHVLDRKSQLKVSDAGISAGIYAPVIRYNKHNQTFYMITTQFAGGIGNMVVKTKDPFQGWSDPVRLKFDGIDPSLFFDDDGKAYVVHNDAPVKALYEGHRVIKVWEYDLATDQVIEGSDRLIVDGGVDITQKPIWIEAPHIYKRHGRYYLMCAEGGTGDQHSEVIFTSDSPMGPYIPAPSNPILSQRYLRDDRSNKVDWAGHADLVETPDGQFYGVFLAVRPNEKSQVNTGRETFMLPVDWSGTYPVFENGLVPMKPTLRLPEAVSVQPGYFPSGNFTYHEAFKNPSLDFRWIGVRGPREDFIQLTENGLAIQPFTLNIKAQGPTSTLFHRQQHLTFAAQTTMYYRPTSPADMAGLVCYQSESFHYVMGVTLKDQVPYIVLSRTEKLHSQVVTKVLASERIDVRLPVQLRVSADGARYRFEYSQNDKTFQPLGGVVPGDILSTNIAGGFTGALIGLYATSANDIVP